MLARLTPAQKFVLAISAVTLTAGVLIGHRVGQDGANEMPGNRVEYTLPEASSVPITVHVVGAVQRPGVYHLTAGVRARDAIKAAGGFTPNADSESVNLAAFVDDGDQVRVKEKSAAVPGGVSAPEPRTAVAPPAEVLTPPSARPATPTPVAPRSPARRQPIRAASAPADNVPEFARSPQTERVTLNRADLDELQRIPGIGPELAKNIIYHRSANGPFRRFEDLDNVPGIGPATIEKIRVSATLN